MKRFVLDSYALLAYAQGESGAVAVANIIKSGFSGRNRLFLSVINWGEIFYIVSREIGAEEAERFHKIIEKYPIHIVEADKPLTILAAEFKARFKISYADAFAAALAKKEKASLVTGDREFKALEKEISVLWLS